MKLFNLPYLAYSRIITSMDPIEVFSLSFCSKKSREKIKQIRFHDYYVGIFTTGNVLAFQLRFLPDARHISIPFLPAPRWARCKGRRFTGTIDGVQHYFRCVESQQGSIIYSNIPKSHFKITNYILDFVRASLSILDLDLNVIDDLKGFITEACMKSVSGIKVVSETVTSEKLSVFFNNIENPVKDVFIYSKVEGEVSTSLNIFRSDRLIAFEADWVTRENFLGFNGKFLCLFNPTIDIGTIIEFIKQWKNGNNTKLAALKMAKIPQELMKIDQFISEFNAKPWDPTKREKCYIYEKEVTDKQNIVADLSKGFDFERDDGLLATINIRPPHFFQFFVWHKRFSSSE